MNQRLTDQAIRDVEPGDEAVWPTVWFEPSATKRQTIENPRMRWVQFKGCTARKYSLTEYFRGYALGRVTRDWQPCRE